MPRLENWSLVDIGDPYIPPEHRILYLHGQVYDHPKHENGTNVQTSAIIGFKSNIFKTKSGSLYSLGEPSIAYENAYPNALKRILESAAKVLPKFED